MVRFVLRRLLFSLLALLGLTIVVFALTNLLGDPRAALFPGEGGGGYGLTKEAWEAAGRRLHLDKPVYIRYPYWLSEVLRGNLGSGLVDNVPVTTKIREKFPATAKLALSAWLVATLVGIPLGVLSAVKRSTPWDYAGRVFALLGQVTPAFWIGLMGIFVFSVMLGWLPTGTQGEGFAVRNYILPTLTLAWGPSAGYLRLTRSAMLEVLDAEYIRLARAKGVSTWVLIWKHAFRNALIVPLTVSGLLMAGLLTGAIVVEVVFSWPGMGRLAVESVWNNDPAIVVGTSLVFGVIFVGASFLVDIAYGYIDPRIRYD